MEPSASFSSAEAWAAAYIESTDLAFKRAPPPVPDVFESPPVPRHVVPSRRPAELVVSLEKPRSVSQAALREPRARARLIHKFWHHELQAAELMCWGFLRFAGAEPDFRRGLLRICRDEIRHMNAYEAHLRALGFEVGAFAVRDWFWERVPTCETPVQFVSLLGMGLEAANLEHTRRFAAWFRSAGDEAGALLQEQIGREEIAHVRFATRWFATWTGTDDFATWCARLPPPLTPLLLRGKTINRAARLKAGMSAKFVDELEAWRPQP